MLRNPVDRAISSYWFKQPGESGGSAVDLDLKVTAEIAKRRAYENCLSTQLQESKRGTESEGVRQARNTWTKGQSSAIGQQRPAWRVGRWRLLRPYERRRMETSCFAWTMVRAAAKMPPGRNKKSDGKTIGAAVAISLRGSASITGSAENTIRSGSSKAKANAGFGRSMDQPGFEKFNGGLRKVFPFSDSIEDAAIKENAELMVHHVNKGVYVEQLERWFDFFPRESFLVFSLEQFRRNAVATYGDVCCFLGIGAYERQGQQQWWGRQDARLFEDRKALETQLRQRYNEGANPSTEAALNRTRTALREFFAPYDEELFELLGVRLWD